MRRLHRSCWTSCDSRRICSSFHIYTGKGRAGLVTTFFAAVAAVSLDGAVGAALFVRVVAVVEEVGSVGGSAAFGISGAATGDALLVCVAVVGVAVEHVVFVLVVADRCNVFLGEHGVAFTECAGAGADVVSADSFTGLGDSHAVFGKFANACLSVVISGAFKAVLVSFA